MASSVTSTGKEIPTATQRQQRNQHEQGPSSSSVPVALQPEDELRKKNTDCVYFLASPLTCKKGSECEYRHSEYARVNPRDCFFWLNGNCLNPKCAFRHPPLDGLLGPQAAGTAGPSLPSPQPVPSSAYNQAKQAVPCIFFQKGYCMKGDKCQFVHDPTASGAKVPQVSAAAGVNEPANFKKAFGLEKCSQQKLLQHVNAAKTVEIPILLKASGKVTSAFPVNSILAETGDPPSNGYIEEHPRPRVSAALDYNGNLKSNSSLGHHSIPVDDQSFQIDKDAEESLRESSPGFDVLVDDQHGGTEYYHNEDQLTGLGDHDGSNLDDYEFGHPDYYNPDADQNRFHDRQSYDSFDHRQQSYGYEHSRASSERSMREAAHFNRRGLLKTETSDRIRESDLRNHLKQRKIGSLRSVVSTDYAQTSCVEDQVYKNTRRDVQQSPPLENFHRSRLQGRLRVPRSSPINGNGSYKDKETNQGLNWGRLSPSKPELLPHQGRLRDRLGRRIQDDTWGNFTAPKSLAELRVLKQAHGKEQEQHVKSQSTAAGKRKLLDNSQQGEGDLSFEGPKPLSEILKRKKRAEASASGDQREENQVKLKEQVTKCHFSAPDNKEEHKQTPFSLSTAPEQHVNAQALNKGGNNYVSEGSNAKHSDSDNKLKSTAASVSEAEEPGVPKIEEGLIGGEDDYHEGANGEYEYEEGEGDYEYEGDVEGYEGEDVDGGEYYMEEDGGDEFAKKIAVVPS